MGISEAVLMDGLGEREREVLMLAKQYIVLDGMGERGKVWLTAKQY